MNMQKTIIDPNPTNAKDMLEVIYYCKGFIDFASSSPFVDGIPVESKDSFEKALDGCFSIGMAILDGSLSGKDKKHTSVDVKTMIGIYYYAYQYIDILQNEMPEELTKDILHNNADEIKEKVRQKLLEMNETLYKSGDIPYEAFEKMKNMMESRKHDTK